MGYTIIVIILTVACSSIDQAYTQNDRLDPTEPTVSSASNHCTVPPKPKYGSRKLHKSHCCSKHNTLCDHCNIQQGIQLNPGMSLMYNCDRGFKLNGTNRIFCDYDGVWSDIPDCVEILCTSLLSSSVYADCLKPDGSIGSCANPAIGTTAELGCRPGYRQNTPYIKNTKYRCNETGYWEPQPIRCIPACGVLPLNSTPLIVNGRQAKITEFPWHATLYEAERPDARKEFICGATIIREDLLLTAAHCVYDESAKQLKDSKRYYVTTGNIYRDYDSPFHDTEIVKKSQVKKIYIICKYFGYAGNYALDIVLLQIEQPFQFTSTLLPICLDVFDHGIEIGAFGRVAGFGRTDINSPSSYILQVIRVPHVPFSQCRTLGAALQALHLMTDDKFCAGYTNGSSVCDGDSGSGLVFQNSLDGLWYLQGIVSTSLGTQSTGGSPVCNSYSYSLYTRVSKHISWIQDIMFKMEKHELIPSCFPRDNVSRTPTTEKPTTNAIPISYNCKVPPQPRNGYWKLHKTHCCSDSNICEHCDVRKDIVLFNSGTILVYSCKIGFKLIGYSNSVCNSNGTWDNIPKCIEVRCKTLLSTSVSAECFKNGTIVSCTYPIPGTIAKVKCRFNYHPEERFFENQIVECNESGYWEPELLRCTSVCGMSLAISDTAELPTETSELPWHAALYKEEYPVSPKKYVCGATIIRENILLTAGHCVSYNNKYSTMDALQYYVVAGSNYQDYDRSLYNTSGVKKSRVKNIYSDCKHPYPVMTIALLEIQEPFLFTPTIQPICLNYFVDPSIHRLQISYPGKAAEYRRTEESAPCILQAFAVIKSPPKPDGLCAHFYTELTSICMEYEANRNDSMTCQSNNNGIGWIVRNHLDGLWYLQGVITVSWMEPHNVHIYEQISTHIMWIKNTLDKIEKHEPIPMCDVFY